MILVTALMSPIIPPDSLPTLFPLLLLLLLELVSVDEGDVCVVPPGVDLVGSGVEPSLVEVKVGYVIEEDDAAAGCPPFTN